MFPRLSRSAKNVASLSASAKNVEEERGKCGGGKADGSSSKSANQVHRPMRAKFYAMAFLCFT